VIDVSWDDAKVFIAWLSQKTGKRYRLPSEAEWEYAARAGTTTSYWWGRSADRGRANCEDCGASPTRQTTPSGTFGPNGFGLFDVAGNAAEWVEDCWNDTYRGAPANGAAWTTGPCRQRVLRGGSFAGKASLHTLGRAFPVRSGRSLLRQRIPRSARPALAAAAPSLAVTKALFVGRPNANFCVK
jgi:formylglycine-generating enzyme required for sulfatase activity